MDLLIDSDIHLSLLYDHNTDKENFVELLSFFDLKLFCLFYLGSNFIGSRFDFE